ncbi:uncharacterized protein C8A04DRAFT_28261 [Dichotomopilus funicola]|uniref:Uncharacterized protein n=1 Tax=Dichotomopilus funicola TaxID=1934379 RepID=A0AAN6ZN91_9PEZI|nr:hypothetical protein C8A04DRAFT_28261 [Dichotomopilus funicola]
MELNELTRACAEDGPAGFSSYGGSIPVAYDNGNDLPDYEDSLCESVEFEDWGGPDAVSSVEGSDQRDGDCKEGEQNEAIRDEEEEEQPIYELRGTPQNLEESQAFDPWNAFLSEQEPPPSPMAVPPKRPIIGDHEGPESDALFDGKTQLQEFDFIAIRRREFIAFTTSMWRDAGGPIRPPRNRSSPGSEPEPKALDELPPLNVIEVNFNGPQTNKPIEFTWMPARALFTAKIKEWNQPWTESENGSAPDRVLISLASKEIEGEGS